MKVSDGSLFVQDRFEYGLDVYKRQVWWNGEKIGSHDGGYSAFRVRILKWDVLFMKKKSPYTIKPIKWQKN